MHVERRILLSQFRRRNRQCLHHREVRHLNPITVIIRLLNNTINIRTHRIGTIIPIHVETMRIITIGIRSSIGFHRIVP